MLPKLGSSSSFNSYFSNLSTSENDIPMVRPSLDVDAEYTEAFHTNSFLNIWAAAHEEPKPTPSPRSAQPHTGPVSNFLLEPTQSSLIATAAASGNSAALLDYLDATLHSLSACAVLLTAIERTRSNHRSVRHHLHRLASGGAAAAASDLSASVDLGNSLSSQNLTPFHRTHSLYPQLLTRLTAERRRLRRRARAVCAAKKAAVIVAVAAVGTVAILTHAAAAAVAAAALAAAGAGCERRWRRWASVKWAEKAGRKVEAAARGAYIVGRDMDTVSRMVRRVHDEVEHRRDVARLVLRSCGEEEMVKEAVREMEMGEAVFQEQMEELEEHVYLCLLTINRSRRMVNG